MSSHAICFDIHDPETGEMHHVCIPLAHIPIEQKLEVRPRPPYKIDREFEQLFDPLINPEEVSVSIQNARKDLVVLAKIEALLAQLTPDLAKAIQTSVHRAFNETQEDAQLGSGITIRAG